MTENLCPRCGERPLHPRQVMNALSRKDNATYVCSPCGTDEAFMVDPWPGFPATLDIKEVDDLINTTPCEECGADAGEQCRWHCTSQPEAALDEWHHLRVVVRPGDLAPALATCTRCRRTTATVRLTAARKCADCITEARHG